MKLLRTKVAVTAYRFLSSLEEAYLVTLAARTYLVAADLTELEEKLSGKFVFVISPTGEGIFLSAEHVEEIPDYIVR